MSAGERERVVVIGAGVGGLAAAIRLAAAGFDVTVLEAAATPGGKMREVRVGDAAIDAGPTVLTMRWVFEQLFAAAGVRLEDEVTLTPAPILARHAWPDGSRLDLFADQARSEDAIAAFAGAKEAKGFARFCADAADTYRTLESSFLTDSRPNPLSLTARIAKNRVSDIASIRPFTSYWRALCGYFEDPRLRQLFGRYATYSGSSPFDAPATLMLIAHVEQQGVWLVQGGMHRLAEALARVAMRLGARISYGVPVSEIILRDGRASAVQLRDGDRVEADHIVFNGDPQAIASGKLGSGAMRAVAPMAQTKRSLSAQCWQISGRTSGFPLVRHNVFFSSDYPAEFAALGKGKLPAEPTLYVCAQDRAADGTVSENIERMLVIANAPANGDTVQRDNGEVERCTQAMLTRLASHGLSIDRASIAMTTPADFETLFPATGGALYGRASHGWMASFQRPGAKTRLPGLWLAGGATHPGAGVPMAALSGAQAAAQLMAARASTPRSHPVAMPGGMSTRSAKTAATG